MIERYRFGYFLLIVGLVFWLYFFASDQSENPQFLIFFSGLLLVLLGLYLAFRHRPTPERSERFRLLRKMSERLSKKKK